MTETTFQSLALHESLYKSLEKLNFITPTEVQQKAIPLCFEGRDLMISSQTGSGKTGAYGIPAIQRILENPSESVLVLAPTRELVMQICDFFKKLSAGDKRLSVCALVGGADMRKQIRNLKKRPNLIVATPGRLNDHLERRTLRPINTRMLILDEGDRMLDMGFAPQLEAILEYLPEERQTLLFTATLPKKVEKLAEQYLHEPEVLKVGPTSQPVDKIDQSVIQTSTKGKDKKLLEELKRRKGLTIIFSMTKRRTDQLAKALHHGGFKVDRIHGGRTQGQRNQAIRNFKTGKAQILCATDVAARGIDVPLVQHVINYDLPLVEEDYIHRIGRTARNGESGQALSLVDSRDMRLWRNISKKYKLDSIKMKTFDLDPKEVERGSKERSFDKKRGRPRRDDRKFEERGSRGRRPTRSKSRDDRDFENPKRSDRREYGKSNGSFSKNRSRPDTEFRKDDRDFSRKRSRSNENFKKEDRGFSDRKPRRKSEDRSYGRKDSAFDSRDRRDRPENKFSRKKNDSFSSNRRKKSTDGPSFSRSKKPGGMGRLKVRKKSESGSARR